MAYRVSQVRTLPRVDTHRKPTRWEEPSVLVAVLSKFRRKYQNFAEP